MSDISSRKDDHLALCARGDVSFRETTTLLECVRLVHCALPDLNLEDLRLETIVLGKKLRAPLVIAGMTGGSERAKSINRDLASLAEERGYAFGLGSQRAMLRDPALAESYRVRDVMPTGLLLGNIGMVQARDMSTGEISDLVEAVGADALCVHLNPAMELVQREGDHDFRGGLATFERLAQELSVPVVAKETGCGISAHVARQLRSVGVRHLDVSGAGGTSWVAVETQRSEGPQRDLGEALWDWGIPTAASVALAAPLGFDTIIATGGLKSGLDVAKAIALGAHAGGIARPVLQAYDAAGRAGAAELLARVEAELKAALLLTGTRDAKALESVPRVLAPELREWLQQASEQR
jgi:isopentenyl-diphosphate delta-isomerase